MRERLSFALDALAAQTLAPERFEVIAVGPTGGRPVEAPEGLRLRIVECADGRPAVRRNAGWREAEAPLVAFTHEDCRPAPDWLQRLLDRAGGAGEAPVFVSGRIDPDPDEEHLLYGIARTIEVPEEDGWYRSANIVYPRALLEELGGFDPSLAHGCDDTDLGLRALAAGAESAFAGDAVVWNAVRVDSFPEAIRAAAGRAGEPALLARHPGQRGRLPLRTFATRDHGFVLLALLGAVLWRRNRLLAALLLAPYVRGRALKRLRNPNPLNPISAFRLAADVAIDGAIDSVEVAAQLRSSAASGELVI
jgi:hypothetical protein